jgi:hypothetical protein
VLGFLLSLGVKSVRSVAEYLEKAVEYENLAEWTREPTLKKRYSDLAEGYRVLAQEREGHIGDGALTTDAPAN